MNNTRRKQMTYLHSETSEVFIIIIVTLLLLLLSHLFILHPNHLFPFSSSHILFLMPPKCPPSTLHPFLLRKIQAFHEYQQNIAYQVSVRLSTSPRTTLFSWSSVYMDNGKVVPFLSNEYWTLTLVQNPDSQDLSLSLSLTAIRIKT